MKKNCCLPIIYKNAVAVIVIILLGIVVFVFALQKTTPSPQYNKKTSYPITVYQTVEGNDETNKTTIVLEDNATALDLIRQKAKVITQGEGQNAFVTEINGKRADNSKKEYWAFYINGKMASVGAGSYQLQNNDKIVWKIEKY